MDGFVDFSIPKANKFAFVAMDVVKVGYRFLVRKVFTVRIHASFLVDTYGPPIDDNN
jgi:hypothetical protein